MRSPQTLRNIPRGAEFTLIVEATYWNAFRGASGDDFTTYSHDQRAPEEISIVAVFPEAKPFGDMTLLAKRGSEKEMSDLTGAGNAVADPLRRSYFWSTTNNTPGQWFYTLKWSW